MSYLLDVYIHHGLRSISIQCALGAVIGEHIFDATRVHILSTRYVSKSNNAYIMYQCIICLTCIYIMRYVR